MSETLLTVIISTLGGGVLAFLGIVIRERVQDKHHTADVKLRRIQQLEARVDALEKKDRTHQDYIVKLRQHIISEQPPPPPPWPVYT